ncbi:MAG: hypothetical protein KBE27_02615 [Syntrophorhabdaceae bacterium]|jgi:endonuclease-3 related protein|nr:hypothetical protein [Syntrophorhabdales bacterium]MBP9560699.1 hypothetical protein [Syntrophorhabdaceae bacterium]
MRNTQERLLKIFHKLLDIFGKRHWWPGETPLEVIVGAVLTQNTTWKNVEKAINNMKNKGILNLDTLYFIDVKELSQIIRPAGYYNLKSIRLKNIVKVLYEKYNASIDNLGNIPTDELRKILLNINGVGKETADSILLYALNRPIFVVDAYTKRLLNNHKPILMEDNIGVNLEKNKDHYDHIQLFFMKNLPLDIYIYNEYHALIVCLCQQYCKRMPDCIGCPLHGF